MSQPTTLPTAMPFGTWSPLTQPTFRNLWLAVLVSNIGTWIHDVSAAWFMAETTGSPFMVSAVQAATTLPVVLLAVLAGTLADIVDRRKYHAGAPGPAGTVDIDCIDFRTRHWRGHGHAGAAGDDS
jgi:Transmembrane secretion effector